MTDLNEMMRIQARNGLQTQLETAVTNGDAEAATKIADDIAKLALQTAPKALPYNDTDIRAELNKLDWFGTDPKKSGRAVELGKHMDPKKFASAELFAAALVKAVDAEFAPAGRKFAEDDGEPDDDLDPPGTTDGEDEEGEAAAVRRERKTRKTDGPGDADAIGRGARRSSGPWTKIADAPADIQKEIKRQADKFVSASAPKEQREKFITKALESHYATHQRNKGKK